MNAKPDDAVLGAATSASSDYHAAGAPRSLLANGASGGWELAVEESIDRQEWFLEMDGPNTYLVFQLDSLAVLPVALSYLELENATAGNGTGRTFQAGYPGVLLGRFGAAPVSLLQDNEDRTRWFLAIREMEKSCLRLTLQTEDVRGIVDALRQVVADLEC